MKTIKLRNDEIKALIYLLGGKFSTQDILSVTNFNSADHKYYIKRDIEKSILFKLEVTND